MRLFISLFIWLLVGLTGVSSGWAKVMPVEFDAGRNRLIAYMLGHQLPAQHFSHEPLNDSFSKAAFDLYIRQLDGRKRFLLQSDVEQLQAFSDHIDDELKQGRVVLADAGAELINDRIRQVQQWITPLLEQGFDLYHEEYLEADPKKLAFAANIEDLKDRWRRSLKMQVLDSYFDAVDELEENKESSAVEAETEIIQEVMAEAVDQVGRRNNRYLGRLLQENRQDHYNRYFDAVARAFDPHTNYMPPTSKEDFDIHMSGSLEGIGALLREDEGVIKVVRIIPGSASERQGGLQAEDTILAVAEKDGEPVEVTDMRIRDAVSFIRGPKGTEVRLTVKKPDGTKLVVPIIRDVVQIEETYVKSTVIEQENGKNIGYIRIPSFYRDFSGTRNGGKGRNVTDDTRAELLKLKEQGIGGLILDLRNNGGGALTDAQYISGLFLSGGPVVQVKSSQGMIRVLEDLDGEVLYDGTMIVLVNRFSASASEILAAALQDYGRALIIGGEHTHGKGTVQALLDMNKNLPLLKQFKKYDDLGALKLTIQKFYRINGGSTQFKGVEPDLVVPSMLDYLESEEKHLDNPLPWDQVENVGYEPWKGARFDVEEARRKGEKWVQENAKFQVIKQEVVKAKKRSEQTRTAVFFDGMIKDREDLARIKKEVREAGLLTGDQEEDNPSGEKKKTLQEELQIDPFVQVSLFLLQDITTTESTVGTLQ